LRTSGRRSLIFSLAGKKSSVGRCPDRQLLGAAVFKKLDDRVIVKQKIVKMPWTLSRLNENFWAFLQKKPVPFDTINLNPGQELFFNFFC